jgi:arginine decarboxylase
MELHGIVHDGYIPCLRVMKASEERGLKRLG